MSKRVIVVGGGQLDEGMLQEIRSGDFLIGADRGALFLIEHGIIPQLAVGDFDSVSEEEKIVIKRMVPAWIECDPVDKDDTDTELALKQAIQQQPAEIILLGVTGSRLDHTLSNIYLLRLASDAGVCCRIMDAHNEVRLVCKKTVISRGMYAYISLIPLTPFVRGVTLAGFKYPLTDKELTMGSSLSVSNQLEEETGTIEVKEGLLLVIQSKD